MQSGEVEQDSFLLCLVEIVFHTSGRFEDEIIRERILYQDLFNLILKSLFTCYVALAVCIFSDVRSLCISLHVSLIIPKTATCSLQTKTA